MYLIYLYPEKGWVENKKKWTRNKRYKTWILVTQGLESTIVDVGLDILLWNNIFFFKKKIWDFKKKKKDFF